MRQRDAPAHPCAESSLRTFLHLHDHAVVSDGVFHRQRRPIKQLMYKPEQNLVVYRPAKGRPKSPAVLEWTSADHVSRHAGYLMKINYQQLTIIDNPVKLIS